MIPIATPLADEEVSKHILEVTKTQLEQNNLVSGIKACQKAILKTENPGIVVLNAVTSPMDLITHIPIICEERNIPYIFVEDSRWINGFTCVMLKIEASCKSTQSILKQSWKVDL